ncbi:MAG: TolB family protein [Candidatus Dormibacteria bacterium]
MSLSVFPDASFAGAIFVASGGRIWRLSGRSATALTPGNATYAYPAVTADGRTSAAVKIGRGHSEIVLGGAGFSNLTPLTQAPANPHDASIDLKPAFSPDGSRLAFMSDRSKSCTQELVYEGTFRPYRPHPVTSCPDIGGSDDAPVYLADGTALLMVSWRTQRAQLEAATVPNGRPRVVSLFDDQDLLDPAPAADGRLAAIRRRGDSSDLFVSPALNGDNGIKLTSFGDVRQAAWSPDGRSLVFISSHDGSFDLWTVAATGRALPRKLTWGANLDANSRPAWVAA